MKWIFLFTFIAISIICCVFCAMFMTGILKSLRLPDLFSNYFCLSLDTHTSTHTHTDTHTGHRGHQVIRDQRVTGFFKTKRRESKKATRQVFFCPPLTRDSQFFFLSVLAWLPVCHHSGKTNFAEFLKKKEITFNIQISTFDHELVICD